MTTTNTFRTLVSTGQIPMGTIMDLRDELEAITEYLTATSLGSLDEGILLRDTVNCLTALSALDHRIGHEPHGR